MEILRKTLLLTTILLIPVYLVKLKIFGLPTNILEILVSANLFFYLIRGKFSFNEFYKENKAVCWSLAAIFGGLLIATLANDNWRAGFGIIKSWFVVPVIFGWIVFEETKTREDLKKAFLWLYCGIFWIAFLALGYYFSGQLTYDGRLAGIYNSPNSLAMYLAPGVFIGLWLAQAQKSKISAKSGSVAGGKNQNDPKKSLCNNGTSNLKCKVGMLLYLIPLFVILVSLYLTYSYTAWLSIAAALLVCGIIKNRQTGKRALLIFTIFTLLIFISQYNTEKFENLKNFSRSSLESRIIIWKAAIKILSENLLWGIGPGNFQNKYLEYQKYFPPYLEWAVPQPHSLYLAFWLQAGILGIAGFIVLIMKWLKDIKKEQKNSLLAEILMGIIFYVLIHGLSDTTYWKNDLSVVFWMLILLGFSAIKNKAVEKNN